MFIKFPDAHHIQYASIKEDEGITFVLKYDYNFRGQLEKSIPWGNLLDSRKERAVQIKKQIEQLVEELRLML